MALLERELPQGELTIDTEARVARFFPREHHFAPLTGADEVPWQLAWEQGAARFHTFFRWTGVRDSFSPWLALRTDPVIFLIPPPVGALDGLRLEYDERRRKLTIETEQGRFPFYVESGTMEWSKVAKLFSRLMAPGLGRRLRLSWQSHRGHERRWQGNLVIDDERLAIGPRHNLDLSLNVYLCKETAADCLESVDPIIRALALLDRRHDRDVLARTEAPAETRCCAECVRLAEACLSARRRLV